MEKHAADAMISIMMDIVTALGNHTGVLRI
jgi:hypothetical protein